MANVRFPVSFQLSEEPSQDSMTENTRSPVFPTLPPEESLGNGSSPRSARPLTDAQRDIVNRMLDDVDGDVEHRARVFQLFSVAFQDELARNPPPRQRSPLPAPRPHIDILPLPHFDPEDNQCLICLMHISQRCQALPCNHTCFDAPCLLQWTKHNPHCPLCRASIYAIRTYADEDGTGGDVTFMEDHYEPAPPEPDPEVEFNPRDFEFEAEEADEADLPSPLPEDFFHYVSDEDAADLEVPDAVEEDNLDERDEEPVNDDVDFEPGPESGTQGLISDPDFFLLVSNRPNPFGEGQQVKYDERIIDRRRRIYLEERWRYQGYNGSEDPPTRYPAVTIRLLRDDAQLLERTKTFLRREITVFRLLKVQGKAPDDVSKSAHFFMELIMCLLNWVEIEDSKSPFFELIAEFLGDTYAEIFIAEILAWLKSPYDTLEEWDESEVYLGETEQFLYHTSAEEQEPLATETGPSSSSPRLSESDEYTSVDEDEQVILIADYDVDEDYDSEDDATADEGEDEDEDSDEEILSDDGEDENEENIRPRTDEEKGKTQEPQDTSLIKMTRSNRTKNSSAQDRGGCC